MLRRREAALAVLAGIAALALGLPALGQAKRPSARAYVVGTYDGTTLRLYVDGKLARQKRVGRTVSLSPKTHVEIGAWFGQSSFEGTIDEVAIYNRSLDAATVADHYR